MRLPRNTPTTVPMSEPLDAVLFSCALLSCKTSSKFPESELLPITHDFLATMLGTDRPSVSLAAGVLQKSQMINYRRGSLRVVNRKKLEKFTCECYAIVQQYAGGTEETSGSSTP